MRDTVVSLELLRHGRRRAWLRSPRLSLYCWLKSRAGIPEGSALPGWWFWTVGALFYPGRVWWWHRRWRGTPAYLEATQDVRHYWPPDWPDAR